MSMSNPSFEENSSEMDANSSIGSEPDGQKLWESESSDNHQIE